MSPLLTESKIDSVGDGEGGGEGGESARDEEGTRIGGWRIGMKEKGA